MRLVLAALAAAAIIAGASAQLSLQRGIQSELAAFRFHDANRGYIAVDNGIQQDGEGDADTAAATKTEDAPAAESESAIDGELSKDEDSASSIEDATDKDALMLKAAKTITKLSKIANQRFGGDKDKTLPEDERVPGQEESTLPNGVKVPHGDAGVTQGAVVDSLKKRAINGAVDAANRATNNARAEVAAADAGISADDVKQGMENESDKAAEGDGSAAGDTVDTVAESSSGDTKEGEGEGEVEGEGEGDGEGGAGVEDEGGEAASAFLQALAGRSERAQQQLSQTTGQPEALPEAEVKEEEAEEQVSPVEVEGSDGTEPTTTPVLEEGGQEVGDGATQDTIEGAQEQEKDDAKKDMENEGMLLEPAPGMKSGAIRIRLPSASNVDLATHTAFASTHGYNEDIGSLQNEVATSEEKLHRMREEEVKKVNFMEEMQKRVDMVKEDVALGRDSVTALQAHVKAVNARIQRLKKEAAQSEMAAQQHQYEMAKGKLATEVKQMDSVTQAIKSRSNALTAEAQQHHRVEMHEMQKSLGNKQGGHGQLHTMDGHGIDSIDGMHGMGGDPYGEGTQDGSNYGEPSQVSGSSYGEDNQVGSNFNHGGSNYNQGTNNYNQGGSNYNQGGSNYNQGGNSYNQGGQSNGGYRFIQEESNRAALRGSVQS